MYKPKAVHLAALLTLALVTAACGRSGAASSGSGGRQGEAAYRQCLKSRGVNLPTDPAEQRRPSGSASHPPSNGGASEQPRPLPSGVSRQQFQAAMNACASKRPAEDSSTGAERSEISRAYLSCLRDNGVTIASPSTGRPPVPNPADPAFQKANAICGTLEPAPASPTPSQ